jgi:radical SAM superfamily enzyme YgiQ (UPF0313 family)
VSLRKFFDNWYSTPTYRYRLLIAIPILVARICHMKLVNNPQFRPPGEARSLILQIDQGCPWNRCTFCGMYKHVAFQRRTMAQVRAMIEQEARRQPHARRIFLADGDVMSRPFPELHDILQMLLEYFPRLTRVGMYANGDSILRKSVSELVALKEQKLHTLYMGLESGDDDVLARCHKRENAAKMVDACVRAQAAGFRMSVMILLGLGGVRYSLQHIEQTAKAINRMQPRLLSALRVIPVDGTEMHAQMCNGTFELLSAYDAVRELRDLVAALELTSTVFRANHSSNVVPVEGRFPHDKARIVSDLDALLASGELDRATPGTIPLWL